jgi:hypothetical protein
MSGQRTHPANSRSHAPLRFQTSTSLISIGEPLLFFVGARVSAWVDCGSGVPGCMDKKETAGNMNPSTRDPVAPKIDSNRPRSDVFTAE